MSRKEWAELPPEQIARAIRGRRKDLDALVRHYGSVVWGAVAARARRVPRLTMEMEDLVSSVWLELCRNDRKRLHYYEPQRGEFGFFIRMQASQIAWNLVLRELKQPELRGTRSEPIDTGREAQLLSRDVLERFSRIAEDRLSESDWVLFNAVYVEGLRPEEIAERLRRKVKTVYQQKYRLHAKLEEIAQELLAAPDSSTSPSEPLMQLLVALLLISLLK